MKSAIRLLFAVLTCLGAGAASAAPSCPSLLAHEFPRLQDEKPQDLCQYAGKVVLVVNTASYCGYTPQYKSLEALYEKYRERGLVVLGFPTNDFGAQEPGKNGEIAAFCENTYKVKFPMFAKSTVKGAQANVLIAELAQRSGQAPRWNFHKYLISRDGQKVLSTSTTVDPLDPAFVQQVEKLLEVR
ncbi:MAG TPA: glutathione peroxidase [Methylibium sp.]